MTDQERIAALEQEVESLREMMRYLAARPASQAQAPWPYNLPQQLWGQKEAEAVASMQDAQARFPTAQFLPQMSPYDPIYSQIMSAQNWPLTPPEAKETVG